MNFILTENAPKTCIGTKHVSLNPEHDKRSKITRGSNSRIGNPTPTWTGEEESLRWWCVTVVQEIITGQVSCLFSCTPDCTLKRDQRHLVPYRGLLRQAENPYKSQIKALQISALKTGNNEELRKETFISVYRSIIFEIGREFLGSYRKTCRD